MKDLYVVNCCRTAVGSFGGSLKNTPAADLGAIVVKEALNRAGVKPEQVDELMFGCCISAGLGQNVARQVGIKAGLPVSVPAYSVNMVCGSGMKSVIEAGRAIAAGDAEIVVCGGTENMSAAPYILPDARWGGRMFDKKMVDTMVKDGLWDAFNNYHMGTTAENICDIWGITRQDLDEFAASSQAKTAAAQAAGKFDDEIVPVPVKVKKQVVDFKVDEFPRPSTNMESLAKLKTAFPVSSDNAFQANGGTVVDTFDAKACKPAQADAGTPRVTAGNASGINDAGAAMIIASEEFVKANGLKPLAKVRAWGSVGCDPSIMGVGPIESTRQALSRAGLTVADLDLIESNEAFAAQAAAVNRELGFDMDKVNVNGGAIALGHPIGAAGCRITTTLIYEMIKRDLTIGLATMCIGGGMGEAIIVERDELCK